MHHIEYQINGMSCGRCVAKVKEKLDQLDIIEEAVVQLAAPQARLKVKAPIALAQIQQLLAPYEVHSLEKEPVLPPAPTKFFLQTYKPLLLIIAFLTGVSLLAQYPFTEFSGMLWMRHFMAGFFLTFSFFKLLNIEGFANSYQMYDIVAARWKSWGYIYPFVELALGILYLLGWYPMLTSWTTVIVLGVSSIGVIKSNLDRRKIKCACLGDVFDLPMSTVTIVEDVAMVAMAAAMLVIN